MTSSSDRNPLRHVSPINSECYAIHHYWTQDRTSRRLYFYLIAMLEATPRVFATFEIVSDIVAVYYLELHSRSGG